LNKIHRLVARGADLYFEKHETGETAFHKGQV
jgi:hypothetical protein